MMIQVCQKGRVCASAAASTIKIRKHHVCFFKEIIAVLENYPVACDSALGWKIL